MFLLLLPLAVVAFGWLQFSRIPTVNVASALSARGSRNGTNYLVVGTDSRAGITANDPNAGAFLSGEVSGARTDTIMVLRVDGATTQLVSIPRDLWVTDPATGQKGRINATFANGPSNLIKAVEGLGIPVDHYLEINFVSFGKLVDSVDGITVDVPYPAKDDQSGLSIPKAGKTLLSGTQALAYVRSRYYEEMVDGKWRVDGTADIGRTERQRSFLTALMRKVAGERNPLHLLELPGSLNSGMKRDTTFGYFDALGLAWTMKDASPEPVALPVTPRRTSGGADVLELQSSSTAVISALSS
ncbi:MAG: LCP family protein [Acidimicrobiia bacterium]|nr:LCP family protein [Acidimicrobiia bacterium]